MHVLVHFAGLTKPTRSDHFCRPLVSRGHVPPVPRLDPPMWTKFHENRTFTFREITTSVTNKRTKQPTNKHARSQYLPEEVIREKSIRFLQRVTVIPELSACSRASPNFRSKRSRSLRSLGFIGLKVLSPRLRVSPVQADMASCGKWTQCSDGNTVAS